jgi:predicted helicase
VGLSACRQFKTGDEYCHVLVSENMIESGYVSNRTSEITYLFPLYLYPGDDGSKERTPNLDTETVEKISSTAGLAFEAEKSRKRGAFSPMDLLDYVYAALHNPGYREKYAEFLKTDFPKVPYPKNANELWAYAKLGARLRKLHLLEPDAIGTIKTRFPIDSHLEGLVDRPRWEQRDESGSLGRVWLNADQYFDRVPLAAWEMRIGGYRPAQKWLKDRQGTRLDYAAIEHYQKIVAAMEKTHETMEELRGM